MPINLEQKLIGINREISNLKDNTLLATNLTNLSKEKSKTIESTKVQVILIKARKIISPIINRTQTIPIKTSPIITVNSPII